MPNLDEHYVAIIQIKRVYQGPAKAAPATSGSFGKLIPGERVIEDITSLSVTKPTLQRAIKLAMHHLDAILEEEDPQ